MNAKKSLAVAFIFVVLFATVPIIPEARAVAVTPPTLVGWGGSGLKFTDCTRSACNSTFPASEVFPSEQASVFEVQVKELWSKGWNVIRASFDPYCTTGSGTYGAYNSTQFARAIKIAQHFNFWIVLDYHGYTDMRFASLACWIRFWDGIVNQFKSNYTRIIWEPLNEPDLGSYDTSAVTTLSYGYQLWINHMRALGDTHWIVVQSLCSYECDFNGFHNSWSRLSQGYPTVTDSQSRLMMSVHPYFTYHDNWQWWNNSTADVKATAYYNSMIAEGSTTGWAIFNTEGGATGTGRGGPNHDQTCPDVAKLPNGTNITGSAGYCSANFHFAQTLTNLLDNALPRMGYLWWVFASWTDTPAAGTYGALSPNSGWGTLLSYNMAPMEFTMIGSPYWFKGNPGSKFISGLTFARLVGGYETVTITGYSLYPTTSGFSLKYIPTSVAPNSSFAARIETLNMTQEGVYTIRSIAKASGGFSASTEVYVCLTSNDLCVL